MSTLNPRIRRVIKTKPLYPLNNFPNTFIKKLAESVCAHLATRGNADLEGKDWEKIFADSIDASWSPSNVGLDDIKHLPSSTAWGAKTVKASGKGKILSTEEANERDEKVRLISGRNSIVYSFGASLDPKSANPNEIGEMVLDIYNTRVREVRREFENLRTVVLVKGANLESILVFEFETDMYISNDYKWVWNKNGNLEGYDRQSNHKFTWQPHGSQFTIVESIPKDSLRLSIKAPSEISKKAVLEQIGFDSSFYKTI